MHGAGNVAPPCLHNLFEAQVLRSPDGLALMDEHQRYTYSELNSYSNLLAAYLRSHGAMVETVVGIFMERSSVRCLCRKQRHSSTLDK